MESLQGLNWDKCKKQKKRKWTHKWEKGKKVKIFKFVLRHHDILTGQALWPASNPLPITKELHYGVTMGAPWWDTQRMSPSLATAQTGLIPRRLWPSVVGQNTGVGCAVCCRVVAGPKVEWDKIASGNGIKFSFPSKPERGKGGPPQTASNRERHQQTTMYISIWKLFCATFYMKYTWMLHLWTTIHRLRRASGSKELKHDRRLFIYTKKCDKAS